MRGSGGDFGGANKHDQGRVSCDPTGPGQAQAQGRPLLTIPGLDS